MKYKNYHLPCQQYHKQETEQQCWKHYMILICPNGMGHFGQLVQTVKAHHLRRWTQIQSIWSD